MPRAVHLIERYAVFLCRTKVFVGTVRCGYAQAESRYRVRFGLSR